MPLLTVSVGFARSDHPKGRRAHQQAEPVVAGEDLRFDNLGARSLVDHQHVLPILSA